MSAETLVPVRDGASPWRGFSNLLRRELAAFFGTRAVARHAVSWLALYAGVLALTGYTRQGGADPEAGVTAQLVTVMVSLASWTAVPVCVAAVQDAVIAERESGTATWVLSKPVSRTAFLLAKFAAHTAGILATAIALPLVVAYVMIQRFPGPGVPLGAFALGAALLALDVLFYLALTLALGTVFRRRTPVIALPLLVLFAGQVVPMLFPRVGALFPWTLPSSARLLMLGETAAWHTPAIASLAWCALLLAGAAAYFERDEL